MSDTLDKEEEEIPEESVLGLSDDDFLAMPTPVVADETSTDVTINDTDPVIVKSDDSDDSDPADNSEVSDTTTVDPDIEVPKIAKPTGDKVDPVGEDTKTDSTINYKAEYDKLTAPFKANGMMMQVNNSEEIITLMQKGAGYEKKMASLKPALKIVKTLEKHGLLNETKINFLIDLNNKNPDAITKMVKDSGIDPMAIDTDAENNYTPQAAQVSETEMILDEVLESIQDTPSYSKTLSVISETWDDASRNAIATNPHIISIINEQIGNGVFDKVYSEVIRARSFGKLKGVSDIEAYKTVGDYLHAQGQLNPVAPATVNANHGQEKVDEQRKNQKKAAAITSGKPASSTAVPKISPLGMSDDEFSKMSVSNFTKYK